MILKTERLNIRRVVDEDWKSIKAIREDFAKSAYASYDIPFSTDDEEIRYRIMKWSAFAESWQHMFFAVCLYDTMIGYISFNIREYDHEIGYCFHSDYHGKGYAKESLGAILEYLKALGITNFSAGTALKNYPSVGLLKSLGFQLTGTEKVSFYKDADWNDIVFDGGIFELSLGKMYAYHVVTDRPMALGQEITFDENHHSGVYQRVQDKISIVNEIYANPSIYQADTLEHHTSVALRELALEEVRKEKYPQYPSRMACLYVSKKLEEAEEWGRFFARIGRPTYSIVKLEIEGRYFVGDARKCFDGQPEKQANLKFAEKYWENKIEELDEMPVFEMLVDGKIKVIEIIKEINANM